MTLLDDIAELLLRALNSRERESSTAVLASGAKDPAAGQRRWVFLIHKPGSDLHDEDTVIRAASREEAERRAAERAKAWRCTLRYIGWREDRRYVWDVPIETLPAWAQALTREDAEDEAHGGAP